MKRILLFGAGKSATCLIDYLIEESAKENWQIVVADAKRELVLEKTNNHPSTEAVEMDIYDEGKRQQLIAEADIVISMMPPALHFLIAKDCVLYERHLLTASYVDDNIRSLENEIKEKGLLFLCETGLDPGIDHMSAMKLLDEIKMKGGKVSSFKSHCGGLVAPESDDNPWHYKISWNPRNVVLAGKAGAEYKKEGVIHTVAYENIFSECDEVKLDGLDALAIYPNRDSLSYIPVYHLEEADTFIRTTLRYPMYCKGWNAIVQAGLANDQTVFTHNKLSYAEWSAPILPYVTDETKPLFEWLGLFDTTVIPSTAVTSADVLQYLLETKLAMQANDKDMIVMLHEIDYILGDEKHSIQSSLIVKGKDRLRTAMAKTVGLPLGIAAKLLLKDELVIRGLHIPILPEIYDPVLKELEEHAIVFKEY